MPKPRLFLTSTKLYPKSEAADGSTTHSFIDITNYKIIKFMLYLQNVIFTETKYVNLINAFLFSLNFLYISNLVHDFLYSRFKI